MSLRLPLRRELAIGGALLFVVASAGLAARSHFDIPVALRGTDLDEPIAVDPTLRSDTLANGLRYYIRENASLDRRIEVRLVVNAGSVLEEEDQRGLAHAVEHMVFRGTRAFPGRTIDQYLESLGMRRGEGANATTTVDETVFRLTIPADRRGALDTALATRDFYVRMVGAAESAQDLPLALDLATEGVGRFPMDDELVVLRVQYLRRNGQLRQALAVVSSLISRNPRAPNAWVQKALVESELGLGPDTLLATLGRGLENGEGRATIAQYARYFGQTASKNTAAPNKLSSARAAIRYHKLADSVQASDTTAALLGSAYVMLARDLSAEPAAAKNCDLAKELTAAATEAQVVLPRAGHSFGDIPILFQIATQLGTYGDQLTKALCQRKD